MIPSHQKTIIIIISNVFGIVFISSISSHCAKGKINLIGKNTSEVGDEMEKDKIYHISIKTPSHHPSIVSLNSHFAFICNQSFPLVDGGRCGWWREYTKIICLLRDIFYLFPCFFTYSVVLRCRLFIYFCGTINSDINKVSLRIICRQISNRSFLCFLSSFFISLVIGSCAELLFWVYFKLTHLCHLFHFTSSLSTLKDDMSLEDVLIKLNHGGNLIWTLRLTLLSARWQVKL